MQATYMHVSFSLSPPERTSLPPPEQTQAPLFDNRRSCKSQQHAPGYVSPITLVRTVRTTSQTHLIIFEGNKQGFKLLLTSSDDRVFFRVNGQEVSVMCPIDCIGQTGLVSQNLNGGTH